MRPSASGLVLECHSSVGVLEPGMAADVWDRNKDYIGTCVVADARCLELPGGIERESENSRKAPDDWEGARWSVILRSAGISEFRNASILTRELPLAVPEVAVSGGSFLMGQGTNWAHKARVEDFVAGIYPVLARAFRLFRGQHGFGPEERVFSLPPPFRRGARPGADDDDDGKSGGYTLDLPASGLCWYDAVDFCNWLSLRAGLTPAYTIHKDIRDTCNKCSNDKSKWLVEWDRGADGYRLPTEAEWEFAASGGRNSRGTLFSGSDDPSRVAALGRRFLVGSFEANELGIHDMSGNVWEWCWDWYGREYFSQCPENNPQGPYSGAYRVKRGGGYNSRREKVSVRARDFSTPLARFDFIGLRLFRNSGGRPRLI